MLALVSRSLEATVVATYPLATAPESVGKQRSGRETKQGETATHERGPTAVVVESRSVRVPGRLRI